MYTNHSLKPYNTLNIEALARYFTAIESEDSLQAILSNDQWKTIPFFILGGGSNILLTKDVDALVIHNRIMGITLCDEDADHVYVKVGAGENWHEFVLYCIAHDYAGIENLSLIPGTVGAAPIQNIGAYGVELKDVLYEVHTMDIEKNKPRIFKNAECELGYRDSIFKKALKNKTIITYVTFRLNKKPVFNVTYGAIAEKLKDTPLSIRAISNAIIKIRQEKLPDPALLPNAGSFFKNPFVTESEFLTLQQQFPHMPYFSEKNKHIKIPAAWLIEQCGLKGKRFNKVGVHEHQALVLVNYDNGTGQEIKTLSDTVQKTVADKFGIHLLQEVNIY